MDNASHLPRRGFLKAIHHLLATSGLLAILGPILAFFWPSSLEEVPSGPISVGDEGSIPIGSSKTVRFGRYPAMIINTEKKGLVAYNAVCTHFACIVKWNPVSDMIECPCHAGFYNPLDGSVISGPPPAPLEKLIMSIESGKIYIGTTT